MIIAQSKLTPAPEGSSSSEAPHRDMKRQAGPDSQTTSPDWHYQGGVMNLGIPTEISNGASFKKIDPVTHKELAEPTGRKMRPFLQPGIVSNEMMNEQISSITFNRLQANGWVQSNHTITAPDGSKYFKVKETGLSTIKMQVVESKWLEGRNEELFVRNITPLMKTVKAIDSFDQRPKDAKNFVFSDKPTRDYFFSPVEGAQSTLININIKDVLCGTALDQTAHAVLERHLAKMDQLVPSAAHLREKLGKDNLSSVDMAHFLKERQTLLESAKTGDKTAYGALHQEEVDRLKAVQSIFSVLKETDATMAAGCFNSERAAIDKSRPYQDANPDFERAATSRLLSRGIPAPK
jgi:hypothetical protein